MKQNELSAYARQAAKMNHLLAALQAGDSALAALAVRIEHPPAFHVISRRTDPMTDVWFPHSGVIALSVTDAGGRIVQTGVVGPEGCVGLENIFQRTPAMADAWVQITGEMSVVSAVELQSALQARPAFQSVFTRFLFELSAQSLQTVACNRLHSLEARCCRWLLMMRDRTAHDDLPLTQQNLASMLGSGRPRVNALLGVLEQKALVQRSRGKIRLLTLAGLEENACECYRRPAFR